MDTAHQSVDDSDQPYHRLSPEMVLEAMDSVGMRTDGRLFALNSYENRVYQVGQDEGPPVIAKFYRPGRWTDEQILEEHAFAAELESAEVPLIAPKTLDGVTLFEHQGFRFSVSRRFGGRGVELDRDGVFQRIGQFLSRLHRVGLAREFEYRPTLTVERMGDAAVEYLLDHGWLPAHIEDAFGSVCEDLLEVVDERFDSCAPLATQRLHGDFHAGNILWRHGPFFVDLDDCCTGPVIQDIWLLFSGDRQDRQAQLLEFADGYEAFMTLPARQLSLVEPLRALRMLHHAAWLARRWDDPAFPMAFPWFNTNRYWEDLVLDLKEQLSAIQEPALELQHYG